MAFRALSAITVGDSASTTRTITRPAGAATDDIIFVVFYIEATGKTVSLDHGSWTKVDAADGQQLADTIDFETHIFWARQGADTADIVASWDGTSQWNTALAGAYTGRLASGDVLDGTGTFVANGTSTTNLATTAMTTGGSNADVIATGHNLGARTYTWSVVAERADFGGQSFADVAQAVAGTTGSKTATLSATEFWAAGMLALKQAVASTDTQEWFSRVSPRRQLFDARNITY